jgi:hypothetical protein
MIKLTWSESNNIELKKLEDLIAKIRATHHRMVAEKHKKTKLVASKQAEIIDPGIIENALYNSTIEAEKQNLKNKQGEEGEKIDIEIHK